MRICHVTPHLPPDQAANALLPYHLGEWAARWGGYEVCYVAHPARQGGSHGMPGVRLSGPVASIPLGRSRSPVARRLKVDSIRALVAITRLAGPLIDSADLVHLHSNGLLVEACAWLAARKRKPTVRRHLDLFTRAYRRASHVTFYSQGLLDHAIQAGLARRNASVIYPPIAEEFLQQQFSVRSAREALGLRCRHLIVNVKRLHPLAGQRYLLQAMGEVIRWFPDSRLVLCGTGALLEELKLVARSAGVEGHTTFAGLVDNATVARYDMAADVFALPSLLEACPTVALEALACGTPVVSSDNPGGVELSDLFGIDVGIVPKEDPLALAEGIMTILETKRRVRVETLRQLKRDFAPESVAQQYFGVYREAVETRAPASTVDGMAT
jgi:glycosyltransferase involved in cell wall biosynthesis